MISPSGQPTIEACAGGTGKRRRSSPCGGRHLSVANLSAIMRSLSSRAFRAFSRPAKISWARKPRVSVACDIYGKPSVRISYPTGGFQNVEERFRQIGEGFHE